jgi:K+-sensing histidine kinase KdpD
LRIEVWDSGPGIPEEKRAEIFEEFRRLDTDDSTPDRGLGLGLAIVERIARMLDHRLSLRSWPGRGSVFAISVPIGDASRMSATELVTPQPLIAWWAARAMENEPAVLSGIRHCW